MIVADVIKTYTTKKVIRGSALPLITRMIIICGVLLEYLIPNKTNIERQKNISGRLGLHLQLQHMELPKPAKPLIIKAKQVSFALYQSKL
jgi:hypothetical protein